MALACPRRVKLGNQVNLWKRKEPAAWAEGAIGDQGVQVGMEVHQVPVGLDGCNDPRNGSLVFARGTEEDLQGIDSALAQLPKEPAILPEVHPEHFGDGEDVLPMRDGSQDLFGYPASKLKHPFLVTGGAEVILPLPFRSGNILYCLVKSYPSMPFTSPL